MGIYRTLLEEEVPHIVPNDDTNVEIKEIEDIVDDHDANEAEQVDAQVAAFGPGPVDDIMSESAMAIYEFECSQNAIMKVIGLHELSEAAAGREFIFEAADIKGFFKKAKDAIVKFFKKVWAVLQKWAGNLAAMFTTNKKLVEKYSKQIKEGASKVDKNETFKGYSFAALDGNIKDIGPKGDKAINLVKNQSKDLINATAENIGEYDQDAEKFDEDIRAIRSWLCGTECDAGEFSSNLREYLFGSSEKTDMKLGGDFLAPDKIISNLNDVKGDKEVVNKFMKETKDEFKKIIDNLNNIEKSVNNMSTKADNSKEYCLSENSPMYCNQAKLYKCLGIEIPKGLLIPSP